MEGRICMEKAKNLINTLACFLKDTRLSDKERDNALKIIEDIKSEIGRCLAKEESMANELLSLGKHKDC